MSQLLPKLNLTKLHTNIKRGISLEYVDLNTVYGNSSNQHIIQDLLKDGLDLKEALYRVLPEGSRVEGYPSCPCGHLKFAHRQDVDGNVRCPKCFQPVQDLGGGAIETLFWIAKPDHVTKFLNPKLIIDLIGPKGINANSFNPWLFLMDPTYKPKGRAVKDPVYIRLDNDVSDGLERDYNYFVQHFRELITRVYEYQIEARRGQAMREMQRKWNITKRLLQLPDDLLLCDRMPLLNSMLMQIEQIGNTVFKPTTFDIYGRAVTGVIHLPHGSNIPLTKQSKRKLSKELGQFYIRLADAYRDLMQQEGQKPGTIKMDILGTRADMTYRGVIVPILESCDTDELHLPWAFGITLLTPILLGRLRRLGMSANEAINYLYDHTVRFDQALHDMMMDILINYCPEEYRISRKPGIPTQLIRYPSLEVHSNQLLVITKIKTEPRDFSLGICPRTLKGYRGDHDGDELTGRVEIDRRILTAFASNHITRNTLDLETPYGFGRAAYVPEPAIQAWVGYTHIYRDR